MLERKAGWEREWEIWIKNETKKTRMIFCYIIEGSFSITWLWNVCFHSVCVIAVSSIYSVSLTKLATEFMKSELLMSIGWWVLSIYHLPPLLPPPHSHCRRQLRNFPIKSHTMNQCPQYVYLCNICNIVGCYYQQTLKYKLHSDGHKTAKWIYFGMCSCSLSLVLFFIFSLHQTFNKHFSFSFRNVLSPLSHWPNSPFRCEEQQQ